MASVYLPLPREERPEAFALLVAHAGEVLAERLHDSGLAGEAVERWCGRLVRAAADPLRRARGAEALALFLDAESLRCFALRAPVLYAVAVGASFRLRPLLAALQREGRFRLLEVAPCAARLRDGDRRGLSDSATAERALPPPARRRARDDALAALARERAAEAPSVPGSPEPLVVVAEAADRAALRASAEETGLAGALLALEGPAPLAAELHARAWTLARGAAACAERRAAQGFDRARRKGRSVEAPGEVARSASSGRLRRLWLDAERRVRGHLDPHAGTVAGPRGDDDVLDQLAALALGAGTDVRLVDAALLQSITGAAAEIA